MTIKQSLPYFFWNLKHFLFSRRAKKQLEQLISAQKAIMLELLLMQYRDSDDNEIQMALDYLRITKDVEKMFPYAQKKTLGEFECVYDNDTKLYYVVHQGKKLFFPKK